MKLKNFLIVVNDIEKSKRYYHELFGMDVIADGEGNVILTDGLVLQEKKVWSDYLEKEVMPNNNAVELYFEETDIETFAKKLETLYPSTEYVTTLTTLEWGQKVLRFYDPDGHLIEVRTPIQN